MKYLSLETGERQDLLATLENTLADGLQVFRAARAATLSRLREVAGRDWERTGRQEGVGRVQLCDLPAMIAAHDAAHRGEIKAWKRARA